MNKIISQKAREIKQKLRNGDTTFGTWMQIPHTAVAEILACSGYDWVTLDLEHGNFSNGALPDLFRALENHGTVPFARVPVNDISYIKHALEAGARGIVVPMVETADDIENMKNWSNLPPKGMRGVGFSRANVFGKYFDDYKESINDELILVAQLENIKVLKNLDDILGKDIIDALMIGPYDLSASMGITAQFEHPDFLEALEKIRSKAKEYKVAVGNHIVHPTIEKIKHSVKSGDQFIVLGTDAIYLYKAAENLGLKI